MVKSTGFEFAFLIVDEAVFVDGVYGVALHFVSRTISRFRSVIKSIRGTSGL